MPNLSSSVYEKFYNDAKIVKLMAQSVDEFEIVTKYNNQPINIELLATLLKFNHLVEFFKGISKILVHEYYNGDYKRLNSFLNEDEREFITEVFNDRNRISHMMSEDALVNPPVETRCVYEMTKKMEEILYKYKTRISEKVSL